MSYQEKRTVVMMFTGALVLAAYCIYAFGQVNAGAVMPGDLKFWARTMLIFIGIGVAATIVIERHAQARLLPAGTIRLASPLARVYLIMLMLLVTGCSDVYIPYFLQVLHGVTPLISGYLVALLALGWTAAAFLTARLQGRRANRVILAGAAIEALATVLLVFTLARHNPESSIPLLAAATVFIFLMGFGIGMGWAHLVTHVLHLAPAGETDKASAAITTMQALGAAFGAALAGIIVNTTGLIDPGGVAGALTAAYWLYGLLALPAALAILLAVRLPHGETAAAD